MRPRLVAVLLFVLAYLLANHRPAHAQADRLIRVGVYNNSPLILYDEQTQTAQGLFPDILGAIANQEGWELTWIHCIFEDCLDMLERGDLDLLPAIASSGERAQRFDFTRQTVLVNWGEVFTAPGVNVTALDDLDGLRIAVLRGDIHYEVLAEILAEARVDPVYIEVYEYPDVLAAVENGQADAGVVNRFYGLTYGGEYRVQRAPILFNPLEVRFAVRSGQHADLLEAIDRDLASMKVTPGSAYEQALQRWLPNEVHAGLPSWVYGAIFGVGVVSVVMVLGNLALRRQVQRRTQELHEHAIELGVLRRIDLAILKAENPTEIAAALLDTLQELIPFCCASVGVFDEATGRYVQLAARQSNKEMLTQVQLGPMNLQDIQTHLDKGPAIGVYEAGQRGSLLPLLSESVSVKTVEVPLWVSSDLIGILRIGVSGSDQEAERAADLGANLASQLAVALRQANLLDRVERHARELEERVQERTADLQHANERLLELSKLKDEFVSNVSHELRTPISSIKLHHHLLKAKPANKDVYIERLERETSRLEVLIENLLLLSRLDQGRAELELTRVDLNRLVQQYSEDRDLLAHSRGLVLTVKLAPDLPPVKADERMLGEVLSILLTNALNYTPEGGLVTVGTAIRGQDGESRAGFLVRDTGPGIPDTERPHLFERFFRGSAARTSGTPGTGLGLSIAHEIIERHGGSIEVESKGLPGEGTTFYVWLPTLAEAIAQETPAPR